MCSPLRTATRSSRLTPDDAELPARLAAATLIVNATSLGWHGDEIALDAIHIPPGVLVSTWFTADAAAA